MTEVTATPVASTQTATDAYRAPTSVVVNNAPVTGVEASIPLANPTATPAPAAEVKPEGTEVQPTAEVETPASRRLAEIARKERARVEREQALKVQQEAWEKEVAEWKPVLDAIKNYKTNPKQAEAAFALLEASGISYEALTDSILSEPVAEAPKEPTIEEKIEAALAKKEAEAQEARNMQALDDFKLSIEQTAEQGGDKYRFVNRTEGSFDMVLNLCVDYFDQHKTVLPLEKAFEEVEVYLQNEWKAWKAKYEDDAQPSTEPQTSEIVQVPERQESQAPKTLTNKMSSEVPTGTEISKDELLRRMMKQLG